MENYELTLVLPGKAKSKEKTVKERIEKVIKTLEGKVAKAESWGEIELSYDIKKEKTGIFMYFELELLKSSVKAINEKLRMDGDVIRYLLVTKNK